MPSLRMRARSVCGLIVWGRRERRSDQAMARTPGKVRSKARNVLASLSERRQPDWKYAEAIPQIFTKGSARARPCLTLERDQRSRDGIITFIPDEIL